jgi:hypothetical protein
MPGLRKLLFIFFLLCVGGLQAQVADSPDDFQKDSIPPTADSVEEAIIER